MRSLVKFAALLFVLLLFPSCAKKDSNQEIEKLLKAHARTDINQFILDKFKDHRIIMIGDAGHDQGIFSRNISSFLNYWLVAVQNGKTDLKNLVLILEADSIQVKDLRKYMVSHEYRDLIGSRPFDFYSFISTADLEFYWSLGDLLNKVDLANANGGNIKFDVLGPEMVLNLDKDLTRAKSESWFVNTRDTASSHAVINYLKGNPDAKALIFYGNAHMAKGKVSKPVKLVPSEGYYMAHYLDQEFGRRFYEIDQFGFIVDGGPLAAPGSSYVIDEKHYNKAVSLIWPSKPYLSDVNATITVVGEPEVTVSWPFVKSKTLGRLALHEIKTLIEQKKLFHMNMGAEPALYLSMLTGDLGYFGHEHDTTIILKNIPVWEKWLNDPKNDVVKEIIAEASTRRLLALIKSTRDSSIEVRCETYFLLATAQEGSGSYNIRMTGAIMENLSKNYNQDTDKDRASRFEYFDEILNKHSNKFIVTDLVQLLWVGTEQERREAVDELQKRTGQKFITAPEWMKWWRENYGRL